MNHEFSEDFLTVIWSGANAPLPDLSTQNKVDTPENNDQIIRSGDPTDAKAQHDKISAMPVPQAINYVYDHGDKDINFAHHHTIPWTIEKVEDHIATKNFDEFYLSHINTLNMMGYTHPALSRDIASAFERILQNPDIESEIKTPLENYHDLQIANAYIYENDLTFTPGPDEIIATPTAPKRNGELIVEFY